MRKFILVTTCALVLTVFIAFNYLVWDRENRIRSFEGNDYKASMDTLGAKISELTEKNELLTAQVNQLENSNKVSEAKNSQLADEKRVLEETLNQKNEVIDKLEQSMNPEALEAVVRNWADCINDGRYEDVYLLQSKEMQAQNSAKDIEDRYKPAVKSVQVRAIKHLTVELPDRRKGEILFKVTFDVKNVNAANNTVFEEGLNDRYFTFLYETEKNVWTISGISAVL